MSSNWCKMMKHNHLTILLLEKKSNEYETFYECTVALPSGTSHSFEICKEDYERLKVKE